MWKYTDYIFLFTSLILGFSVSAKCPIMKSSGELVKFRPPAWVFGIAWTILYMLLGLAWVWNKEKYLYFIAINIALNMWIIFYSCMGNKKAGPWIIAIALMITGITYTNIKNGKYLLVPLITWLLFALLMNSAEVQALS